VRCVFEAASPASPFVCCCVSSRSLISYSLYYFYTIMLRPQQSLELLFRREEETLPSSREFRSVPFRSIPFR